MRITTENYFDQVKKVDFSKVPAAMSKSHDLVKKVGTGSEPWANYRGSEPIRNMIDKYFDVMEKYLAANPKLQVAAPKAAKPAPAPKPAKLPKSSKEFKFNGGDTVEFLHNGQTVKGNVQPYTGGKAKLSPDGRLAVWVPTENRELDLKSTDLKLFARFADRAPHQDMLPSGRSKPAPAPKAEKPAKVKAEKPAKAPRAKKAKPVDDRDEVPHLSAEVQYVRPFLRLVGKRVTIEQVRALHRKLEKDITKRHVRIFSHHADLLTGIADTVASLYDKMTDREIGVIEKLEFTSEDAAALVVKATALVGSQRVGTATTLLSAFINMQGTIPTEKAVANLQKKLANEYAEHPNGDFALQVGAADAILRDWKPGKVVRITKQQLSGLSGLMALGCPDTPPGKACGCGPKKARR